MFKETPVKLIGVPASNYNAREYKELQSLASKRDIPVIPLHQGQVINLEDDVTASIYMPDESTYLLNNFNNHSVVTRINYGRFSVLLTGDIEEEAIKNLLSSYKLTHTTVVKVPHHGSKNSAVAELYEQADPEYAVICVGKNNNFGHPHPLILKMLKKRNIKVLRTDENGAISFVTNGKTVNVTTFFPAKKTSY